MVRKPYIDARTSCTNFVRNLHLGPTNDMLGLVSYNPTATLDSQLTTNGPAYEQAINAMPGAAGGTCISCGLVAGEAELFSSRHRSNALPVMVLMSDGLPKAQDGDSPAQVLSNAMVLKNAGVRVFTVGLGDVDLSLMASAASSTNDFFHTTNSPHLGALFDAISNIL